MRIPQQFHQFIGEHALIVVASKQDALIYEARDGILSLTQAMKVSRPQYSDNEGHFKARSQSGGVIRSGSVKEIRDQEIVSNFIRELKGVFSKIRPEGYTDVYLTAAAKSKHAIIQAMPAGFRDKLRNVVEGTYNHTNPIEVIDMVTAPVRTRTAVPVKPEAVRILRRPEQPHRITRP